MKKFISTFFLFNLVFLSTLSNTSNASDIKKGIFNQIADINQNSSAGSTKNYQVTGNEVIVGDLNNTTDKSFWPVQKPINWNITGQSGSERIQGTLGLSNTSSNSVSGKLTIKNVGSLKDGTNIKNASTNDANGYISNLTPYFSQNGKGATETPAVYVVNSNLDVSNSVFAGSSNGSLSNYSELGSAIHVRKLDTVQITDASGKKQTVSVSGTPVVNIQSSNFIENKTNDNGAAINVDKVQMTVKNSNFVKNTAEGHAGALDLGGTVTLSENKFYNNTAKQLGGAIFVHNYSKVTSTGNIFENNSVTAQNGGAVENIGDLTIDGDTYKNNSTKGSTGSGGAVSNDYITRYNSDGSVYATDRGTANIKNSTFTSNTAANTGGAVYNLGTTTSQNNTYQSNQAKGGGAVSNEKLTNLTDTTFTSTGDTYKNNSATSVGGAVYNTANASFKNAVFSGNAATNSGGAIYNTGSTVVDGATFNNNTAAQGGAIHNSGTLTLNNAYKTKFYSNNSSAAGSAIYNTGIVNINNASDTIDLDYNPHTDKTAPTKKVRLFADGEDIYNNGVINVRNSDLQLHYDNDLTKGFINVHESLTKRKTGTINAYNSRIDIGKSILYGDAINIYDGSELLTHVNAASGKEFGQINANNIYVSPNDTDITIIVAAGEHLKEGETKVFKILNASDELNAAAANGFKNITENKMYEITYLGDGNYQLSRPGKEPEPSDPEDSDPEDSDPEDSDPVDSDPEDSDPEDSDPVDSDPEDSDPEDSDPEDSDPEDSDPEDSDPVDSDPEDSDPEDSDPEDSDPDDPDQPKPDDPKDPENNNICPNAGCIHNAWVEEGKMIGNETAIRVQNVLNEMAQRLGCDSKEYKSALDAIAPDVTPLIQAHSTDITRRLAATVNKHMSVSMERTAYKHRGKRFYYFPRRQGHLWVDAVYGNSKFDADEGFDMDNKGLAVGFDKNISDNNRMGIAYAYTKSEGESLGRDTEIDSHTVMLYGEYNPNRFYTNWLALYTRSNYEEEKKVFYERVNAEYDVDVFAAQVMIGKKTGPFVFGDWATGVISPETGLRYTYLNQHDFTDQAGQNVKGGNGHVLTGVLGAQYVVGYAISPTLAWYPEFRAAVTYDFITPDMEHSVTLVNGSRYRVVTENLDRFGIEVGARIGLDINQKAEVALEYEGLFKGDYTNHTGLASLKYKF